MLKDTNRGRFTLVQMILACLLCVGIAGAAARYQYKKISAPIIQYAAHPESEALKAKYGPHRNSYSEEEWCIRDFFNDRRDGFFVDVGANDYRVTSNTYYLDTVLNWKGIAIEPQKQFEADYVKYRPRTKFVSFFVSDASNQLAKMYLVNKSSLIASGNRDFAEQVGEKAKEVEVPTITLNDLLDSEGVKKIDFMGECPDTRVFTHRRCFAQRLWMHVDVCRCRSLGHGDADRIVPSRIEQHSPCDTCDQCPAGCSERVIDLVAPTDEANPPVPDGDASRRGGRRSGHSIVLGGRAARHRSESLGVGRERHDWIHR